MFEPGWQGHASEVAFLHRAAEEGLDMAKPCAAGCRYDAIADNGQTRWLVQVKSTSYVSRKDAYRCRITRGQHRGSGHRQMRVCYKPSEIDFIVIYVVPEKCFYVFPFPVLRGKKTVTIRSARHKKKGQWDPYREAWHLFWPTNLDAAKLERSVNANVEEGSQAT